MKFIALVPFSHDGIPGYPMTSDSGAQISNGEGSGYSRVGHVPASSDCIMYIDTSEETYNAMVADPEIKILKTISAVTGKVLTPSAKAVTDAVAKCAVLPVELDGATAKLTTSDKAVVK